MQACLGFLIDVLSLGPYDFLQYKCATQQVLHSIPAAGHQKKSLQQQRVISIAQHCR
jgi:hypothetical protein